MMQKVIEQRQHVWRRGVYIGLLTKLREVPGDHLRLIVKGEGGGPDDPVASWRFEFRRRPIGGGIAVWETDESNERLAILAQVGEFQFFEHP